MRNISSSKEAIRFTSQFQELRDSIGGNVDDLAWLASSNETVSKLCDKVFFAYQLLKEEEQSRREKFAESVSQSFISDRKEYDNKYAKPIGAEVLRKLLGTFPDMGMNDTSPLDCEWRWADEDAEENAKSTETAIGYARDIARFSSEFEDPDTIKYVEKGVTTWERLKNVAGLDVRGVLRRRALVPFILVPHHMSGKWNGEEKTSLLAHLQQAHDAFIFGTPFASLALMRSIMEAVLLEHYTFRGKAGKIRQLSDLINDCNTLPIGIEKENLRDFKNLADGVLHLKSEKSQSRPEGKSLEQTLARFLLTLKALIELAPSPAEVTVTEIWNQQAVRKQPCP